MSPISTRSLPATTWLSELRASLALGGPLVLTNVIEMSMNLISTLMIGHIGPDALAASTLALALYNAALLFGLGLTTAVSPLIARGAGDLDRGEACRPGRLLECRIDHRSDLGYCCGTPNRSFMPWANRRLCPGRRQTTCTPSNGLSCPRWSTSCFAPCWPRSSGRVGPSSPEPPLFGVNAALNFILGQRRRSSPGAGAGRIGPCTLAGQPVHGGDAWRRRVTHRRFRDFRFLAGFFRPHRDNRGRPWRLAAHRHRHHAGDRMFAAAAGLIGHYDEAISGGPCHRACRSRPFAFVVPLGFAQAATVRVGSRRSLQDDGAVGRGGWTALMLGSAPCASPRWS